MEVSAKRSSGLTLNQDILVGSSPITSTIQARVVKQADAADSKSVTFGCGGSIPSTGTILRTRIGEANRSCHRGQRG